MFGILASPKVVLIQARDSKGSRQRYMPLEARDYLYGLHHYDTQYRALG
jgi:hypothetical protein